LGIGIGVLTSMVLIVLRTARPNNAVLGRLPRTNIFRDLTRYPEAQTIPGVLIFRFDASLHFANKDVFHAAVSNAVQEWQSKTGDDGLTAVVIEFSPVNDVDASALRMLQDLLKELKEQHLRLLLAGCKGPVRDMMRRSGFLTAISPNSLCVSLGEAAKYGARLHAVRTSRPDLAPAPSLTSLDGLENGQNKEEAQDKDGGLKAAVPSDEGEGSSSNGGSKEGSLHAGGNGGTGSDVGTKPKSPRARGGEVPLSQADQDEEDPEL